MQGYSLTHSFPIRPLDDLTGDDITNVINGMRTASSAFVCFEMKVLSMH